MKKLLLLLLLAALPLRAAEKVDQVAVIVGEEPVTLYDLQRFWQELGAPDGLGYRKTLEMKITDTMIAQEIERLGITVSSTEVDRAIESEMSARRIDRERFVQELALAGLTEAEFRKTIASRLKQIKVVNQRIAPNVSISESELREAYAKWSAEGSSGRVAEVRVCLLPWKDDEEREKAGAEAGEIARLARGGADFGELVKSRCQGPSQADGGRLQIPVDDLQPSLREIVLALAPGGISDPVAAAGVWTLIQLEKMGAGTPASFEQQRETLAGQIKQRKYDELYTAWVEDLRGRTSIKILLEDIPGWSAR